MPPDRIAEDYFCIIIHGWKRIQQRRPCIRISFVFCFPVCNGIIITAVWCLALNPVQFAACLRRDSLCLFFTCPAPGKICDQKLSVITDAASGIAWVPRICVIPCICIGTSVIFCIVSSIRIGCIAVVSGIRIRCIAVVSSSCIRCIVVVSGIGIICPRISGRRCFGIL